MDEHADRLRTRALAALDSCGDGEMTVGHCRGIVDSAASALDNANPRLRQSLLDVEDEIRDILALDDELDDVEIHTQFLAALPRLRRLLDG